MSERSASAAPVKASQRATSTLPSAPVRGSGRLALWLLAGLALAAILAPLLAPFAVDAIDLANRRAAPSLQHWFGTDELGRDVFTRILHGARISLLVGLVAATVSVGIGTAVGLVAGWRPGLPDTLLMRGTDAMLAIPRLPLLMLAAATLTPGVPMLVVLVGLVGWMETARVVRAEVRSVRSRDFVQAAQSIGVPTWRVAGRHVLPAVLPVVAVAATLAVGRSILLESVLSFFGVGVQPPTPSWGNMLQQAQTTMTSEPWLAVFPGVMIFLTVLTCNSVGDALGHRPGSS